ncbi:MAG: phosphoadenosine phosphosulfate reductase family protein, partial [Betaproteobacteria bacterium]|nr:phosphoadenosine phosphosulfate reductase family protein [Betaproteobacteria bacterium]
MTDGLRSKIDIALALLHRAGREFAPAAFANSLGAEDMVLTDLIFTNELPIEVFTLDTGRLPIETYTLIDTIAVRYGTRLRVLFPRPEAVESYVKNHGING